MNVILAGMPGSGKTTVSLRLGALMGREVYDTDALVTAKHGVISDIFATYGEARFRELETQAVKEVCAMDGVVVATGGGCLMREENVALFASGGKIIFLRTGFHTLLQRVAGDTSRPLLRGDAADKMKRLLEERTPLYERAADFTVDTDGLTPDEIARRICVFVGGA